MPWQEALRDSSDVEQTPLPSTAEARSPTKSSSSTTFSRNLSQSVTTGSSGHAQLGAFGSEVANRKVEDHRSGREDEVSSLLSRFSALYKAGQLDEAANTLEATLAKMEPGNVVGSAATRGGGPVHEHSLGNYNATPGLEERSDDQVDAAWKEDPSSTIAGVLNDLGCTLQQVGVKMKLLLEGITKCALVF